ncbi:hypothetical protein CYMTET_18048 [Cymbomonas tetramitiformis]|uniref:Uncharacterized protein n=1 Tax=Cymbomonas tetramitiformis TaxID=36881 RepID=A0AAE0GA69_9CHLO|nr:hypothetical protein CYMTET_18048 [Cymbomonas tetramitiformis]
MTAAVASSVATEFDAERVAWANKMRLAVSPAECLDAEGGLVQDFFKPKKVVFVEAKVWANEDTENLYKGLEKYGIGQWSAMRHELLPKWEQLKLKVKASRLLGAQSIARYTGMKMTRSEVDAEYKINKEIGDRTGCWKAGVLVENDEGSVALALAELEKEGQSNKRQKL